MDNNKIRRKILEVLYKFEQNDPGRKVNKGHLKEKLGIDYKQIDFNINWLEGERYVKVDRKMQTYFSTITNRGINLIENKKDFNRVFPSINLTQNIISKSKGVVIDSNSVNISIEENINIENSFNEIYKKIEVYENSNDIKERIKVIEDELKKDNVNTSRINDSADWLKTNASWTILPLIQIIIALYGLYLPK